MCHLDHCLFLEQTTRLQWKLVCFTPAVMVSLGCQQFINWCRTCITRTARLPSPLQTCWAGRSKETIRNLIRSWSRKLLQNMHRCIFRRCWKPSSRSILKSVSQTKSAWLWQKKTPHNQPVNQPTKTAKKTNPKPTKL